MINREKERRRKKRGWEEEKTCPFRRKQYEKERMQTLGK